jgi:radical SAM superfamily enzyme YgiQ (UPF0313 family)
MGGKKDGGKVSDCTAKIKVICDLMTDGIIFTGMSYSSTISRPAGAVRIRTWLSKHGYDIEVIDYFDHFSNEEIGHICDKFINEKTLFVGISLTFLTSVDKINFLFKLIKTKFPHVKTIIGGTETSINKIDVDNIDRIMWGYAEEAILHYVELLNGKRFDDLEWVPYKGCLAIDAEKKYKNDDTDLTIEWNDSDLIDINYLPVEISRGCIFRCRFCQYPLLGKKKNDYIRYEDNLADEFRRNWEKWGVNNYSFQDDTFNDNIVKLEHVANAIEKSGVKITYAAFLRADLLASYPQTIPMLVDTGLISVNFGIESFNLESKKAIGKGFDNEKQFEAIKELKKKRPIYTFTGMIVGLPFESKESLRQSQDWFLNQHGEVFNMWQWWPLAIRTDSMTRMSDFDKNYTKWGYVTANRPGEVFSYWKNDYMDFYESVKIAANLNNEIVEMKKKNNFLTPWNLENKDVDISMYNPAELYGIGISIENIINQNYDSDILEKLQIKIKNSIQNYKNLKLK